MLEPLDYLGRVSTERRDYPSRRLRREVGPLRTFESSGAEFVAYLKLLCGLGPTSDVLDIGCGCGLVPLQLGSYFTSGSYTGVDIQEEPIAWCQEHIALPNDRFELADVKSGRYNADGSISADAYQFPFPAESFDVVMLKSVFTHLGPVEVEAYLREVARLIRPAGRAIGTFFLLNAQQAAGHSDLDLRYGDDDYRYVSAEVPEEVSAHSEASVRAMTVRAGLRVEEPMRYGAWYGREDALSYQDMVIFSRASS